MTAWAVIAGTKAPGQDYARLLAPQQSPGPSITGRDQDSGLIPLPRPGRSIARIEDPAPLLRRINAIELDLQVRARRARQEMITAAADMIGGLAWEDFVMLVDMVFAGAGWRRVSRVFDRPRGAAYVSERFAPAETAQVVLWRNGTAQDLAETVSEFEGLGRDHIFLVMQSMGEQATGPVRDEVEIWTGGRLAELAINTGVYGWLLERAR